MVNKQELGHSTSVEVLCSSVPVVSTVNDEGSAVLDSTPHASSSSAAAAAVTASASQSPSPQLSALPPSPLPRSMKPQKTTSSSSSQIQAQHLGISKDHKITASKPRDGAIQTEAEVDTGLQTSQNLVQDFGILEDQKITASTPYDDAILTGSATAAGLRTSQNPAQGLEVSDDQKITASKPHDQAIAIRAVLDVGLQTSQNQVPGGRMSQDQKITASKPCCQTSSFFSSSLSTTTTAATTTTTNSRSSSGTTTKISSSSKHLLPSSEPVTQVSELGKPEGRADSSRHPMTTSTAPSVCRSTLQGVRKSNEKSQESSMTTRQSGTRSNTMVSDRHEEVQCNWKVKSQTLNTKTRGAAVRGEDCSSWVGEQSMKIERRVSEARPSSTNSRKTRQSSETPGDDAADLRSRSLIRQRLKVRRAYMFRMLIFREGGVVQAE